MWVSGVSIPDLNGAPGPLIGMFCALHLIVSPTPTEWEVQDMWGRRRKRFFRAPELMLMWNINERALHIAVEIGPKYGAAFHIKYGAAFHIKANDIRLKAIRVRAEQAPNEREYALCRARFRKLPFRSRPKSAM